ncbi:MAG: phage tail assembly chaperone [Pandoraea sp.]|nr:phage tail assembly chaperone [Pandoraea sp.]MDR3398734.1 phage tail assembly chaperone [Pandoraea sp.]
MKTFAQILDGRLHWKFEAEEQPEFAPDFKVMEITGFMPTPNEGDLWDGKHFAAPPPPVNEDRSTVLRRMRDAMIERTDWLVQRHRDEQDMKRATTMSADAFAALLLYRQTLRDLPIATGFPDLGMPALPDGIAEMLEAA